MNNLGQSYTLAKNLRRHYRYLTKHKIRGKWCHLGNPLS